LDVISYCPACESRKLAEVFDGVLLSVHGIIITVRCQNVKRTARGAEFRVSGCESRVSRLRISDFGLGIDGE
jgi:hypothetical protein